MGCKKRAGDFMITAATKKNEKAKTDLLIYHPFFAYPLLSLQFAKTDDESMKTMATDGRSIFYNENFVEELDANELMTILAHETLHCLLLHHIRLGDRDRCKANIAMDYVVNLILSDSGFFLPKNALLDPQYRGMDFIQVYNLLPKNKKMPEWGGEVLAGMDMKNLSPEEVKKIVGKEETKWQKIMKQAQASGKLMGNNSNDIDCLADISERSSSINYKEILANFVFENAKKDWSWQRPKQFNNFILPKLNSKKYNIGVAIDVSGSINDAQLAGFIEELNYLRSACDVSVTAVFFDLKIQKIFELDGDYKAPMSLTGGGGTDYIPVFDFFEKNPVSGIIIYTDGLCNSFPDLPPDCNTIWLVEKRNNFCPPFGKVIFME